jgi:hypothetical protein
MRILFKAEARPSRTEQGAVFKVKVITIGSGSDEGAARP